VAASVADVVLDEVDDVGDGVAEVVRVVVVVTPARRRPLHSVSENTRPTVSIATRGETTREGKADRCDRAGQRGGTHAARAQTASKPFFIVIAKRWRGEGRATLTSRSGRRRGSGKGSRLLIGAGDYLRTSAAPIRTLGHNTTRYSPKFPSFPHPR
jgi:hypothetical protein